MNDTNKIKTEEDKYWLDADVEPIGKNFKSNRKTVSCVLFSLVIRGDSLENKYPGGLNGFLSKHDSVEYSEDLVSICVMNGGYFDDVLTELDNRGFGRDNDYHFFDVGIFFETPTPNPTNFPLRVNWLKAKRYKNKVHVELVKDMDITKTNIRLCERCCNYRGSVEEKYNGLVPVHCVCTLIEEIDKYGHWKSPCMVYPRSDRLWWAPRSSHYGSDGKLCYSLMCHKTPTMNNHEELERKLYE